MTKTSSKDGKKTPVGLLEGVTVRRYSVKVPANSSSAPSKKKEPESAQPPNGSHDGAGSSSRARTASKSSSSKKKTERKEEESGKVKGKKVEPVKQVSSAPPKPAAVKKDEVPVKASQASSSVREKPVAEVKADTASSKSKGKKKCDEVKQAEVIAEKNGGDSGKKTVDKTAEQTKPPSAPPADKPNSKDSKKKASVATPASSPKEGSGSSRVQDAAKKAPSSATPAAVDKTSSSAKPGTVKKATPSTGTSSTAPKNASVTVPNNTPTSKGASKIAPPAPAQEPAPATAAAKASENKHRKKSKGEAPEPEKPITAATPVTNKQPAASSGDKKAKETVPTSVAPKKEEKPVPVQDAPKKLSTTPVQKKPAAEPAKNPPPKATETPQKSSHPTSNGSMKKTESKQNAPAPPPLPPKTEPKPINKAPSKPVAPSKPSTSSAASNSTLKTSHPSVLLLAGFAKPLPEAVRRMTIPRKKPAGAAVSNAEDRKLSSVNSEEKKLPEPPVTEKPKLIADERKDIGANDKKASQASGSSRSAPVPVEPPKQEPSHKPAPTSKRVPTEQKKPSTVDWPPSTPEKSSKRKGSSRHRSPSVSSKKQKIDQPVEKPVANREETVKRTQEKEEASAKSVMLPPAVPAKKLDAEEAGDKRESKSSRRKRSSSSRQRKKASDKNKDDSSKATPALASSQEVLIIPKEEVVVVKIEPVSPPYPEHVLEDNTKNEAPTYEEEDIKPVITLSAPVPIEPYVESPPAKPAGKDVPVGGLAAKIAAAKKAAEARKGGPAGKKGIITFGVLTDDCMEEFPTSHKRPNEDIWKGADQSIADVAGSVDRICSGRDESADVGKFREDLDDGPQGEANNRGSAINKKNAPRKRPPPASKKAMPGMDETAPPAPVVKKPNPAPPPPPAAKKPNPGPSALRKMVARMVAPAATLREVKPPTGRSLGPAFGSYSNMPGKPPMPKQSMKAMEIDISSIGPMGPKGTSSIVDVKIPNIRAPPRGRGGPAAIKLLDLDGLPPMPANLMPQNTKATGPAARGKQNKKQKAPSPELPVEPPTPASEMQEYFDDPVEEEVLVAEPLGLAGLEALSPEEVEKSPDAPVKKADPSSSSSSSSSGGIRDFSKVGVPDEVMADHLKAKVIQERMIETANGLPNADSIIMPDRDAITDDILWDFMSQRFPAGFKPSKMVFEPMTKSKPQRLKVIELYQKRPCGIIASAYLLSLDEGATVYLCRWRLKKPDEDGQKYIYRYVPRWELKVYCPALLDAYEKANFGCDAEKLPKEVGKCVIMVRCNPADLRHCRSRTMDAPPRDHLKELEEMASAPKTPLIDTLPEDVVDGFGDNLFFGEDELVDIGFPGEESPVNVFDADGFRKPNAPEKKTMKRKLLEDLELGYLQPGSGDSFGPSETDLWLRRKQGEDSYVYPGGFYEAEYDDDEDDYENDWEPWQDSHTAGGKQRPARGAPMQLPGNKLPANKMPPRSNNARIPSLLNQEVSPPAMLRQQNNVMGKAPLPPPGHPSYQSEDILSQITRYYGDHMERLKARMEQMKATGLPFPSMPPQQASLFAGLSLVNNMVMAAVEAS